MDRLLLDLRVAFRRLGKNPAFAVIAMLTLALGVGANTAVFSIINAILLNPLPVPDSGRLVSLNQSFGSTVIPSFSYPDYRDIRDRNTSFSGVYGYRILPVSVGTPGSSLRAWGYLVTGNYFGVLGVKPYRGRLIAIEDDVKPGGHPLAVLSYQAWQKRFGGDERIVGSTARVNGQDFTVIGITPPYFFGTELFFRPDAYFPMMMQKQLEGGPGYLERRGTSNTWVGARLKPGVTNEQATANITSIAHQLAQENPKEDSGMRMSLSPPGLGGAFLRGPVIGFAVAMFVISGLVLIIACTNLASMLLARSADRRKDTAIRLALGANRVILVRQLLTENLVVAIAGGLLGALVALWIAAGLASWRPPVDIPIMILAEPDTRVFLFALGISVFTTLLFGLMPALQSTRTDLVPALKNEAASERFRHWHLRDYVVATQVCLSAILLVCSVLVVRSLQHALDAPLGYNPKGAVTASYDLNLQNYAEPQGALFHRKVLARLRDVPGFEAVTAADSLPLSVNNSNTNIYVEGRARQKDAETPSAYEYYVAPDYFRTMQTRLLAGREFDQRDRDPDGPRVAIVNSAFAQQLVGTPNALGKRFSTTPDGKPLEIIGIVETGPYFSLNNSNKPAIWRPLERDYSSSVSLVVRTPLGSNEALRILRRQVRDLDPSIALYDVQTLNEQLALPLFPARLAATALGAFGLLVLVLAVTGIYGVMAYAVSRRTREIGIRMAIGASREQVLTSVLRSATILVGLGTVAGLIVAYVLAGFLRQLLYGIEPTDPLTYLIVALLMASIAAAGSYVPAMRAIRIDPMRALRQE